MTDSELQRLVCELRDARTKTYDLIASLQPADLEIVSQIRSKTVREMLRMMITHYKVHWAQIYNQRIAIGDRTTEVNELLAEVQTSYEEALSTVVGAQEDTAVQAPSDGEWSAIEVLEHLLDFEVRYQREFARILAAKTSREDGG